jgi:hypothetical protein
MGHPAMHTLDVLLGRSEPAEHHDNIVRSGRLNQQIGDGSGTQRDFESEVCSLGRVISQFDGPAIKLGDGR